MNASLPGIVALVRRQDVPQVPLEEAAGHAAAVADEGLAWLRHMALSTLMKGQITGF